MPRPKGSKNKPKLGALEKKEDRTALENEIIIARQNAIRRKKAGKPAEVVNLIRDYDAENLGPPKGKPYGTCKHCGGEFEQEYSRERNAYSSWRICPTCRKERSKKPLRNTEKRLTDTGEEEEVNVATLPYTPYPWQVEAEEAFWTHRFSVLACGNRSGKDRYTIMVGIKYFVECLNENRLINNPELVPPVLWWQIAPTEKMAKQNWRELKQYFPKDWIVACSDSNYQMETIGGGIIEVRSGYSAEDLVGVGLDLVTITEGARFKDLNLAWANLQARLDSPGRGRKKDRMGYEFGAGKAIINSSPLGRNDFYDLFCYGQKSHDAYNSMWWSCQYPWTCNPVNADHAKQIIHGKHGDLTYEEALRRQIGERAYRSNYMADFMAEDGAVFKEFEDKCVVSIYNQEVTGAKTSAERKQYIQEWQQPMMGEQYVIGYDPATGSSQDTPAVVVRRKSTNQVVRIFDLYGKTYTQQYDYISEIAKQYNYAEIHWLRTGHTAIEGEFEKRGLAEIPLDEQGQNKGKLVQTLELAVENGAVQVLYDGSAEAQTLIDQMKDYSEQNGKYSNDKAPHDDFVSAMYAAFSDYSVHEVPIFYSLAMSSIK